jgi:hypothetical protein
MRSVLLLFLCACSSTPVTADSGVDSGTTMPDTGAALALGPGEVAELVVQDGIAGERIATPSGTEQLVVIVGSTRFDGSKAVVPYSIATDSAQNAGASTLLNGCSIASDPWKNQPLPSETPPSGTAVMVGAKKTIQMSTPNGSENIDVQAIAVGKTAVVWADVTQAHPANLDMMFVTQFLSDFDDIIIPRERTIFGVESDLDGDGHIGLVFTPLTYQTAVAFFTQCDLEQVCTTYNAGEYLYLTPPAAIMPPYNTPNAIKETLAHELSHLIHFNRKVLRNQLSVWTDSGYMIEGVGGFAQDVIGYQAGNLYVAKAGLDGINQFSLAETLVDRRPYDTKRDGVLRGDSYWFVRWYYDRAGGDLSQMDGTIKTTGGPVMLRQLLDAKPSMAKQLPMTTMSPIEDIAMDFYTTLAMSSVPPKNGCFAFLPTQIDPITMRQRGGNTTAKFAGGMIQMTGPSTQTIDKVDGQILPGGVEYVRIDATPGQSEIDLTVTVDASALPRVRVARIK